LTAANIKSSPDDDIPARKKPRLQCWIPVGFNFEACQIPDKASLPTIAAEADTLNASLNASVAVVVASDDAGTYPVAASPTQLNVGAARAPLRRWTPEEDTKLTSAVKTTCKKKHRGEYRTEWVAVAALVPGRTTKQCKSRWHGALDSKGDETTAHVGKWTKEEDSTLEDAIEKHNGEDWAAISELVPGRTKQQCQNRWHDNLRSKTDEATARTGRWTKEEDSTLKDAVEEHNGKDWTAMSTLVPGRTKQQCKNRWYSALDSKSGEMIARAGKWTTVEGSTLKEAVEKNNGQRLDSYSELVPGRTKQQRNKRSA
jgi:hypothetical protein